MWNSGILFLIPNSHHKHSPTPSKTCLPKTGRKSCWLRGNNIVIANNVLLPLQISKDVFLKIFLNPRETIRNLHHWFFFSYQNTLATALGKLCLSTKNKPHTWIWAVKCWGEMHWLLKLSSSRDKESCSTQNTLSRCSMKWEFPVSNDNGNILSCHAYLGLLDSSLWSCLPHDCRPSGSFQCDSQNFSKRSR